VSGPYRKKNWFIEKISKKPAADLFAEYLLYLVFMNGKAFLTRGTTNDFQQFKIVMLCFGGFCMVQSKDPSLHSG
jgi:hypothetical protein